MLALITSLLFAQSAAAKVMIITYWLIYTPGGAVTRHFWKQQVYEGPAKWSLKESGGGPPILAYLSALSIIFLHTIVQMQVIAKKIAAPPSQSFTRRHLNFLWLPTFICDLYGYTLQINRKMDASSALFDVRRHILNAIANNPGHALLIGLCWLPICLTGLMVLQAVDLLSVQLAICLGKKSSQPFLEQYPYRLEYATFTALHLILPLIAFSSSTENFPRLFRLAAIYAFPVSINMHFALMLVSVPRLHYLASHLPATPTPTRKGYYCKKCHKTILKTKAPKLSLDDDEIGWKTHQRTSASLLRSALEGCRICSAVMQHRSHTPRDIWGTLLFWKPTTSFKRRHRQICVRSNGCRDRKRNICVFDLLKREDLKRLGTDMPHLTGFQLGSYTGSRFSFFFILRWLYHCTKSHRGCNMHGKASGQDSRPFNPTRLIYIPNSFKTDGVRIQITSDNSHAVPYTTLSHCWGGNTPVTLRKDNLSALQNNIPYNQLPKTFQDAINVSRFIGVDYIWIDSLCIIQDSIADWRQEALAMRKVYENSFCNIAASDSNSSEEGLFHDRNPRIIELEDYKDKYLLATATDMYPNHILYSRGWVFQESFLAPRVLDFTKGQIFWRCPTIIASEVFPNGMPAQSRIDSHPAIRVADAHDPDDVFLSVSALSPVDLNQSAPTGTLYARREIRPRTEDYHSLYSFWARIVMSYSSMQFTEPSDRIIALSGVAESLGPTFGTYLGGLWSSLLPKELLWKPLTPAQRMEPPRAPSWSWLSLESQISYISCRDFEDRDHMLVELLHVETSPYDGPNGALFLKGRIQLRAPLMKATWTGDWDNEQDFRIDSLGGQERLVFGFNIGYGRVSFDMRRGLRPQKDIYILGIVDTDGEFSRGWTSGLVLQAIDDKETTFERVGHFDEWSRDALQSAERRVIDLL